ncbi:MAG: hypothetical protein HYY14_06275 [Candidatus Omnitrophica bacterium]|nr:hypothetical protein [Candidatus Omnitrophota bacterium]
MLPNRVFAGALLGSVGLHAAAMSLFTVVLGPHLTVFPRSMDTIFLGAVLEERLWASLNQGTKQAERDARLSKRVPLEEQTSDWDEMEVEVPGLNPPLPERETAVWQRTSRSFFAPSLPSPNKELGAEPAPERVESPILLEGPAGTRPLIWTPGRKEMVSLIQEFRGARRTASFKFWVSEEGWVTRVIPIRSTGFIESDNRVMQVLRRFRFAPREGGGEEMEWGVATLEGRTDAG